jgi:hypothetical protein
LSRASGECREVNLEAGLPYVDQAIRRLTFELNSSRTLGYSAVKIIHGYGSSGSGGKIRIGVRRYLDSLMRQNRIKLYQPGEEFSIFSEKTRVLLNACPSLRKDRDLERHNNGVTFVLL